MTSDIVLETRNTTTMSEQIATVTLASRLVTESTSNDPRPFKPNTFSTTIVPAISPAKVMLEAVDIGISEFRKMCRQNTVDCLIPRVIAVSTNSWDCSALIEDDVTCEI